MEDLGISRATFMRDIDYLRLFFQAPIVYVRRPTPDERRLTLKKILAARK